MIEPPSGRFSAGGPPDRYDTGVSDRPFQPETFGRDDTFGPPQPPADKPAPTPTDCPACGEPAGQTIPATCPACGEPRLVVLRFMDPSVFEQARAVLDDRGLVVHARHPNRGYQGMGSLFLGLQQPPGLIWVPVEQRDEADQALDDAGLPVPGSGRPIVDRSEPICPGCGQSLDAEHPPAADGQCPTCALQFDWIDIEAEALAAGDDAAEESAETDADARRRSREPRELPLMEREADEAPADRKAGGGGNESAHRSTDSDLHTRDDLSLDHEMGRDGSGGSSAIGWLVAAIRPALLIGGLVAGYVAFRQGDPMAWLTAAGLLFAWILTMIFGPSVMADVRGPDHSPPQ